MTILAALVAFFGLLTTWLTRPHVEVTANSWDENSANVYLVHAKGSSPARNLYFGWGALDENGIARSGDGGYPWVPTLISGDSRFISVFDPDQVHHQGEPSDHEMRLPINKPFGIIMDLSWQRPMLPWLRTRRVVLWTQADRAAGKPPTVLKGRAAERAYRVAMTPPE